MRNNKLMLSSALVAMLAIAGCGQSGSAPESAAENEGGNAAGSGTWPAAPKFESIVLPAGTSIEVTVDQSVSSKTNNAGDRFDASVATPVVVNGKQVIPAGASITGTVTVAKSAGRFKGNAEFTLTLNSVTSGRKRHMTCRLPPSRTRPGSRGKRTAVTTGVGAAAGAVIGAIAGGGKGAAIGAGVGAGAGAVGAAVTGERDVELPGGDQDQFRVVSACHDPSAPVLKALLSRPHPGTTG